MAATGPTRCRFAISPQMESIGATSRLFVYFILIALIRNVRLVGKQKIGYIGQLAGRRQLLILAIVLTVLTIFAGDLRWLKRSPISLPRYLFRFGGTGFIAYSTRANG